MALVGALGSFFSVLFGTYSHTLETLLILMVFDTLTGGIVIPIYFRKSPKSKSGCINSKAFGTGIARKFYRIVMVAVAYRLDLTFGINYLMNALVIAFIFEETISLVENGAIMGVPLPKFFTDALDVLKTKVGRE